MMLVNKNNFTIFFIMYFPSFLIYHFLLAYEIIEPFLGGYLVLTTLILFIPSILSLISFKRKTIVAFSLEDKLFYIFLIFFSLMLVINFIKGANEIIVLQHILVIIEFAVVYLIFRYINLIDKKIFFLSYLIVFSFPFLVLPVVDKFNGDIKFIATYQDIGFFYIIITMILLVNIKKSYTRFFIYICCLLYLYLLGARSEFAFMFIIFFLNELYLSKKKFLFLFIFLVILILILLFISVNFDKIIEVMPDSRIKYIFISGLELDQSQVERNQLLNEGLDTINNYWIFGNYASYNPGYYIHNILSVWVDLGIIGFSFILFLIITPFIYINKLVFIKKIVNEFVHFLFFLSFLVILMIFFLKSFTYLGLPIMWSIFARTREFLILKKINGFAEKY